MVYHTYIWLEFWIDVGKYSIHGAFGITVYDHPYGRKEPNPFYIKINIYSTLVSLWEHVFF